LTPRAIRATKTRAALPWHDGTAPDTAFPERVLTLPVVAAARELLGCVIVSTEGASRTAGVIVETEAYGGPDDPASHAATVHGPTERNRVMFGPPGRAYVYRSYGVHWCMNVVTGPDGIAQAVLIRGVEPIEGEEVMTLRRGGAMPLAAGPGRLCAALGISDALYGHDLRRPPLELLAGWRVPDASVGVSTRIGIAEARDWPYRFFVNGSPGVSRGGSRPRDEG
jgi:DNA-3-methyladenine glycosylase